MSAASLLREVRLRHGLSQAQLARRAGTTARQVGRIEREEISPSVRTLQRLIRAAGEDLRLESIAPPRGDDAVLQQARADLRALTVEQRVAQALALSRTATSIAAAGAATRGARS
jgi:transcriptional regulator with XRE-family HTH domain